MPVVIDKENLKIAKELLGVTWPLQLSYLPGDVRYGSYRHRDGVHIINVSRTRPVLDEHGRRQLISRRRSVRRMATIEEMGATFWHELEHAAQREREEFSDDRRESSNFDRYRAHPVEVGARAVESHDEVYPLFKGSW